jgi:hypothetical protein
MILKRSELAGAFVMVACACALFVGGAALNYAGLNYSTDLSPGGLKIHPYTLLTLAALLFLLGGSRSMRSCVASKPFCTAVLCAGTTILILLFKAATGDARSLGFAVDTLVSAFLLAAVLSRMPHRFASRLAKLGFAFVVIECVLAMAEVVTSVNVIPIDTWYGSWFRATALHGHPLNNALILVTVATCMQINARPGASVTIFALTVCALTAFGARGGLAVYVAVNVVTFVRFGLASANRIPLLLAGGAIGLGGLLLLLLSGVVGERIAQVGAYDNSSQVRLQSLDLVTELDWHHVLTGIASNDIERLMNRAQVGVIENFMIGYVLIFGAALTAVLFYCVYATCKQVLSDVPTKAKGRFFGVYIVFFCTALTNNSLMTKTPALYLLIAGLWCASARLTERSGSGRRGVADDPAYVPRVVQMPTVQ